MPLCCISLHFLVSALTSSDMDFLPKPIKQQQSFSIFSIEQLFLEVRPAAPLVASDREVNMSCTILHFVSDPNWRPTFRYHHWSISLIAAALCVIHSGHSRALRDHLSQLFDLQPTSFLTSKSQNQGLDDVCYGGSHRYG